MKFWNLIVAALLIVGLTAGPALADATATSEAGASVEQNYGDSIATRQIPSVIPNNPWPNAQYHNAPHTRTWNIFQFAELAKIRRYWTREQLEVIVSNADGDKGEVTPIPYNAVPDVTPKNSRTAYDTIGIIFSTVVPKGYVDKGIVQSQGDYDTNGLKMAAQALLDGLNMGGVYLMVVVDDAEIKQFTKARSFFIGGGMSAIGGDGRSGAMGGGAVSGIGAGSIVSSKGLAPHATCVVLDESGNPMMLKNGKVVPLDEEHSAINSYNSSKYGSAADLDEAGRGPKPVAGKDENGDQMKKYFIETQ